MTLQEFFAEEKLTKDSISSVAEINDYYEKASDFVLENWNKRVDDLSLNQYRWAEKIREDLTEKRIEGRL